MFYLLLNIMYFVDKNDSCHYIIYYLCFSCADIVDRTLQMQYKLWEKYTHICIFGESECHKSFGSIVIMKYFIVAPGKTIL
jgi:hypothetical protein